MRTIGTIAVAGAALLAMGAASAALAGAGEYDGAGTPIIHRHAYGVGQDGSARERSGRSVGYDRDQARFGTGFGTACDTSRVESSFCRDEY